MIAAAASVSAVKTERSLMARHIAELDGLRGIAIMLVVIGQGAVFRNLPSQALPSSSS